MKEFNHNDMPISLDTAIDILGWLQCDALKKGDTKTFDELKKEENIILGLVGSESERILMFDKVYSIYAPQIKLKNSIEEHQRGELIEVDIQKLL